MSVEARFFVAEMTTYSYNPDNSKIVLRAVSRGEQNKSWASATPSGELTMQVGNPKAVAWFKEQMDSRREIRLRFDPAPEGD
jgi:hypothetical protein